MGNQISAVADPAMTALHTLQHEALALATRDAVQDALESIHANKSSTVAVSVAALIAIWVAKDAVRYARDSRKVLRQGVPEQTLHTRRWWLLGLHRYLLGHALEVKPALTGDRRGPEIVPFLHGEEGIDGWSRTDAAPLIFLSRFVLGRPMITVSDPKALHTIFSANSYRFVKPATSKRVVSALTGDASLIIIEGETHKRHRRIINPLFNAKTLKPLVTPMIAALDKLFTLVDQSTPASTPLPFRDLSSQLTLNVIGRTAMNYEFNALSPQGSPVSRAYRKLNQERRVSLFFLLGLQFPNTIGRIPTRSKLVLAKEARVIDEAIKDMLRNAAKDPDGTTLIHELLRQNENNTLTEDELLCEIRTFLAAGHETTSSALTSCVLLLAQFPIIQQELVDELAAVDLDDYDTLSKLPQLNAVINETLRLFPPLFRTLREVGAGGVTVPTTAFGPLELPEGFRIEVPIRGIHCDPHIWGDDALTWNPRRWNLIDLVHGLNEVPAQRMVGGRRQIGQYDFFPFLMGPRACIGRQFAIMELRLFVAGIVQRYKLTTDVPIGGEKLKSSVTLRMTNAWVQFTRRDG